LGYPKLFFLFLFLEKVSFSRKRKVNRLKNLIFKYKIKMDRKRARNEKETSTGYYFFRNNFASQLTHPISNSQINSIAGSMWRNMSIDEKSFYLKQEANRTKFKR
jgi:hypothetical protein